eukprot:gnl/TRDRNA2_/TRDRNA2_158915_c2_seq2.p1 gnl/TRDRNA2_/TRDRNA2_158915_c2~~gnl/TRDRNA2_/TRDRNA2_158915_c2_seq2.p1  ORF type:complete len:159 (-),score=17.66 gnl/TRDRNA2_/TRDRNA2_158915_c2_seq2:332-808(-)
MLPYLLMQSSVMSLSFNDAIGAEASEMSHILGGVGVGWTPLMICAHFGFVNGTTKFLAAGAQVNIVDSYNRNALTIAAKRGHLVVARMLIEKKAMVVVDTWNRSPMDWAKVRGDEQMQALLAKDASTTTQGCSSPRFACCAQTSSKDEVVVVAPKDSK